MAKDGESNHLKQYANNSVVWNCSLFKSTYLSITAGLARWFQMAVTGHKTLPHRAWQPWKRIATAASLATHCDARKTAAFPAASISVRSVCIEHELPLSKIDPWQFRNSTGFHVFSIFFSGRLVLSCFNLVFSSFYQFLNHTHTRARTYMYVYHSVWYEFPIVSPSFWWKTTRNSRRWNFWREMRICKPLSTSRLFSVVKFFL